MSFTAEDFQKELNVSRETMEKLKQYDELLQKWQKKINLVGPATMPDRWRRHFLDSAQLLPLIPEYAKIHVDMGSGAGFPGLVLAIMTGMEVHLIESDLRKCLFMREVVRVTGANVTVHNKRIEKITDIKADVISARALASLSKLLDYANSFLKKDTLCVFPKGKRFEEELTELKYVWYIKEHRVTSVTDDEGVVLVIRGIEDVRETARTSDSA
ncbi:16S rRNA (guanine(527)-N(7))-methyltransferase RsmG [Curvivirga aplysinae]|uniref:16S rRNA (guanine(527)-N(7))-methyltransferase RsmG n=1 Tax=Curvivirga aplysinae TaxID=2529852 RepID=UPI0012BD4A32|nr:16S rRNA (guanine(527)-N(7))-methyltransferase RsmG [Curvivirga aplysinae]MTI09306.1 16S rRNA (guanine(527)-N(7))-methyltransferase RsmG [Curvivirga aplysinae]